MAIPIIFKSELNCINYYYDKYNIIFKFNKSELLSEKHLKHAMYKQDQ